MLDRQPAEPRPGRARPGGRRRLEAAGVERVRDVAADVRVHAERVLEEEAAVLRDRRVLAKQVLEHRNARAGRVDRLRHLRKLHRVTEQDERPRGRAERERVRERDLPGLVDEEVIERPVELGPAEEPGRAGDELHLRVGEARVAPRRRDEAAGEDRVIPARRLLQPAELDACLGSDFFDLAEQVVDRLVARRGDADPLATRAGARSAARPSTSCPTRAALHEEVAALDLVHEPLHLFERLALHPAPPSGGSRRSSRSRCG